MIVERNQEIKKKANKIKTKIYIVKLILFVVCDALDCLKSQYTVGKRVTKTTER